MTSSLDPTIENWNNSGFSYEEILEYKTLLKKYYIDLYGCEVLKDADTNNNVDKDKVPRSHALRRREIGPVAQHPIYLPLATAPLQSDTHKLSYYTFIILDAEKYQDRHDYMYYTQIICHYESKKPDPLVLLQNVLMLLRNPTIEIKNWFITTEY